MKNYDLINANNPKLNAFDLSHNHFLTMNFGELTPIAWFECVPGDVYDLDFQALVRVQPMIAPIMNNITCVLDAYFVPSRLLFKDFEKFITTIDADTIPPKSYEGSLPVWLQQDNNPEAALADIDTSSGKLWDCFGLSRIFSATAPAEARPIDLLRRGYIFIYNEWYRDENLQDPIDYFNSDFQDLFNVAWQKDYFTSAFYDRQKGTSPSIPITGFANTAFPDTGSPNFSVSGSASSNLNVGAKGVGGGFSPLKVNTGGVAAYFNPNAEVNSNVYAQASGFSGTASSQDFTNWLTENGRIDLSNLGTFNVSDMRDMFAIQRFLESLMRGGSRYIEFLQYQFGVSPTDARLQIPERIGGSSFNIQVSEVLQTGETTSTSVQGNMSGHGLSVTQSSLGNYKAEEFGYILILGFIKPPAVYVDRIPRELMRKSLLEQYNPAFVNLSYQAILLHELYALGNTDSTTGDFKIFGYQGRYDEMREKLSYVSGDFYDKLAYYLNFRKFDDAPALNSDFITCRPNTDIFAVTDEPPFLCNFWLDVQALRPIPFISEPGLLDHVYGA